MAADDLVMQGTMSSVAMVLTKVSQNISSSAPEGFEGAIHWQQIS